MIRDTVSVFQRRESIRQRLTIQTSVYVCFYLSLLSFLLCVHFLIYIIFMNDVVCLHISEILHIHVLLLSRFSRVRLCATPQRAAHQAPPSLGFSRQEYWSELPFPSPMHESEKWKVKVKSLSCVRLLATPWTAAYQAPPSMGFSRQEYWSGVPLPSPIHVLEAYKFNSHKDWEVIDMVVS